MLRYFCSRPFLLRHNSVFLGTLCNYKLQTLSRDNLFGSVESWRLLKSSEPDSFDKLFVLGSCGSARTTRLPSSASATPRWPVICWGTLSPSDTTSGYPTSGPIFASATTRQHRTSEPLRLVFFPHFFSGRQMRFFLKPGITFMAFFPQRRQIPICFRTENEGVYQATG